MASSVLGLLTSDLQLEIDTAAMALAEGSSKSFEEYRETVGLVRGLSIAQRLVSEAVQRHRTEDD